MAVINGPTGAIEVQHLHLCERDTLTTSISLLQTLLHHATLVHPLRPDPLSAGRGPCGQTLRHRLSGALRQVPVRTDPCRLPGRGRAGPLRLLPGVRFWRGRDVRRRRGQRVRRGDGVPGDRRRGGVRHRPTEGLRRRVRVPQLRGGVRERRRVLPQRLRAEARQQPGDKAAAATGDLHPEGSLR